MTPSPEATRLTRQRTRSSDLATHPRDSQTEKLSPANTAARALNRTESTATRPSIEPIAANQPRPARESAAQPQTTAVVESPAFSPSRSAASDASPSARSLAMQKSNDGSAGEGASPNFGRAPDSIPSPATSAMDSRRRENPTSRDSPPQSLSPSQQSARSRATAGASLPQHTVPAVADIGAVAGSRDPGELTASSAAALTSASATAEHEATSVDKGQADVDVGTTKIVGSVARREISGGGQPELNMVQPAAGSQSSHTNGTEPRISSDTVADVTAAPTADGSTAPHSDQASPNAESELAERSGGSEAQTIGISRSEFNEPVLSDASVSRNNDSVVSSPAPKCVILAKPETALRPMKKPNANVREPPAN